MYIFYIKGEVRNENERESAIKRNHKVVVTIDTADYRENL